MDLWKSLNGMVQIELTSADPAAAISQINTAGIRIYGAKREDGDIVSRFRIRRQDMKKLRALAEKRGYDVTVSRKSGIYWIAKRLLHRPVLTVGALLFLVIAMYLPTRVFFFGPETKFQR